MADPLDERRKRIKVMREQPPKEQRSPVPTTSPKQWGRTLKGYDPMNDWLPQKKDPKNVAEYSYGAWGAPSFPGGGKEKKVNVAPPSTKPKDERPVEYDLEARIKKLRDDADKKYNDASKRASQNDFDGAIASAREARDYLEAIVKFIDEIYTDEAAKNSPSRDRMEYLDRRMREYEDFIGTIDAQINRWTGSRKLDKLKNSWMYEDASYLGGRASSVKTQKDKLEGEIKAYYASPSTQRDGEGNVILTEEMRKKINEFSQLSEEHKTYKTVTEQRRKKDIDARKKDWFTKTEYGDVGSLKGLVKQRERDKLDALSRGESDAAAEHTDEIEALNAVIKQREEAEKELRKHRAKEGTLGAAVSDEGTLSNLAGWFGFGKEPALGVIINLLAVIITWGIVANGIVGPVLETFSFFIPFLSVVKYVIYIIAIIIFHPFIKAILHPFKTDLYNVFMMREQLDKDLHISQVKDVAISSGVAAGRGLVAAPGHIVEAGIDTGRAMPDALRTAGRGLRDTYGDISRKIKYPERTIPPGLITTERDETYQKRRKREAEKNKSELVD